VFTRKACFTAISAITRSQRAFTSLTMTAPHGAKTGGSERSAATSAGRERGARPDNEVRLLQATQCEPNTDLSHAAHENAIRERRQMRGARGSLAHDSRLRRLRQR